MLRPLLLWFWTLIWTEPPGHPLLPGLPPKNEKMKSFAGDTAAVCIAQTPWIWSVSTVAKVLLWPRPCCATAVLEVTTSSAMAREVSHTGPRTPKVHSPQYKAKTGQKKKCHVGHTHLNHLTRIAHTVSRIWRTQLHKLPSKANVGTEHTSVHIPLVHSKN